MFAVQADGHTLSTVEGLAPPSVTPLPTGEGASGASLHPLQQAFWEAHGLQCGFCTPGILMTIVPFLETTPHPTEADVRAALSGNLCRCTGYQHIVDAVLLAARKLSAQGAG
jgi:carbon-monoxide dehydrogenase small subunit